MDEQPEPAPEAAETGPAPQLAGRPSQKIESASDVMFRNVVSTHVDFTYIADHKAYLMITINSLVLAGMSAILVPRLGEHGWLIPPTILLCLVCLTALALSVIAVRPKLGGGMTSREAVRERKANLLFFGNFHKMSLEDFDWAMHEMLDDEETLVSNMVRDVYFLGKGLGVKYKYVSASYTVFLWGMTLSVLAYMAMALLHFYEVF
jgi:hypothetical protein